MSLTVLIEAILPLAATSPVWFIVVVAVIVAVVLIISRFRGGGPGGGIGSRSGGIT